MSSERRSVRGTASPARSFVRSDPQPQAARSPRPEPAEETRTARGELLATRRLGGPRRRLNGPAAFAFKLVTVRKEMAPHRMQEAFVRMRTGSQRMRIVSQRLLRASLRLQRAPLRLRGALLRTRTPSRLLSAVPPRIRCRSQRLHAPQGEREYCRKRGLSWRSLCRSGNAHLRVVKAIC